MERSVRLGVDGLVVKANISDRFGASGSVKICEAV
jgi:hypothetical protein